MKRLLPLLLALLLLAACGTAPAAAPDPVPPAETETGENTEILPVPTEGLDEDELPILSAEDGETPTPALSDIEVTLDGISSFLRVTLPEGWTWEQAGGTVDGTVYALYPEDDPDFKVELRLWPDGFGMCGTGVTFSDYSLPDGGTATLATEEIGGSLNWILILPQAPDSFTIQFGADRAAYEAHLAELELMLGTIRQGVLAGLDPVTPQTVTG